MNEISHFAKFYQSTPWITDKTFPRFADGEGVRNEYIILKRFVFLKRVEYEIQVAVDLAIAEVNLLRVESLLKVGILAPNGRP